MNWYSITKKIIMINIIQLQLIKGLLKIDFDIFN
jgi:hypothetical protein